MRQGAAHRPRVDGMRGRAQGQPTMAPGVTTTLKLILARIVVDGKGNARFGVQVDCRSRETLTVVCIDCLRYTGPGQRWRSAIGHHQKACISAIAWWFGPAGALDASALQH
jgi:hypothetical protein